jgi:P-type E1-E2 ATPase
VEGDPMEGALLAFAGKVLGGARRGDWRRRDAIPFDSRHRYMAVLTEREGQRQIHVKGAPERVLGMCGGDLDTDLWHERADALAGEGHRVLALAAMPAEADGIDERALDGGLTLLGLVGLIDPPRAEAIAAVAECRAAGISVKMITGDHAGTAAQSAHRSGWSIRTACLPASNSTRWTIPASPMPCGRPTSSPAPRPSTSCAWSQRCSRTG